MTRGLDIVVVMPGAASLGAFQAGAAAAVIAGCNLLRRRGRDVRIPAVGGASAGATVALLAAHALAQGLDPVKVLQAAWVDGVDLDVLTTGARGPLGSEGLRARLRELLTRDPADFAPTNFVEPADVRLHIALTTLRGYRYLLHQLGRRPVDAVTYADWSHLHYPAGQDPALLCRPEGASAVDIVIASTANPAVFPPALLDRSQLAEEYARRGLVDVSDGSDAWWFIDGGLVQSRPIYRTLALVPVSGRDVRCAVIDPRSEGPSTGKSWADPDRDGEWLSGLMRAMSIFPAQVLSDELRRIDRDNRIRADLAELAQLLEVSDPQRWNGWLADHDISERNVPVFDVLVRAAGLESGQYVHADVIHPLLVAESRDVSGLLAGELLGDFAGFLSRDLRQSDFSLGYACARRWWEATLDEHGLGDDRAALLGDLDRFAPPAWERVDRGRTQLSDIPLRDRRGLARVAARALRALVRRGRG